jgi:hypothetical protein
MMTLTGLDKDAAVIKVPGNRLAKFQRENPDVENFITWGMAQVNKKPVDLLTDDAKLYMNLTNSEQAMFEKLDASKINDPEYKRIKGIIKKGMARRKDYDSALQLASHFGMHYTVKRFEPSRDQAPMHSRYPLLASLNFQYGRVTNLDDVYLYMNAKYAKMKKEGKV